MKKNPYRIPNKPNLTIREVMVWAAGVKEVTLEDLVEKFDITNGDASVRLLKLYRWGYLRRKKSPLPPKVFHYWPTKFGRKRAKKWKEDS